MREVNDEEVAQLVERGAVELNDFGVDNADGLELTQAESAQRVGSETHVFRILDLQVDDAGAEALVLLQLSAPAGYVIMLVLCRVFVVVQYVDNFNISYNNNSISSKALF